MLLLSVLLFLGVLVGITINMMASFLPFIHQMNNMQNYYNSYYGAVSALEQGLLATKYKQSGFISTGGNEDIQNFGRLENMYRNVNSRTDLVADGNINYLYGSQESSKRSKLDYNKVATLSFSMDNSSSFSADSSKVQSNADRIIQEFDLPKELELSDNLDANLRKLNQTDEIDTDVTNGRYARTGFNMVRQDGKLYLWLDSRFKTQDNEKLPLLEYILNFNEDEVGDKKFNIVGKSEAKDYTTELYVEKSTKDILSPEFKKTLFPEKPN